MEPALRAVCKDVRIGKILIQTNLDSGEPEVTSGNQWPGSKEILCRVRHILEKCYLRLRVGYYYYLGVVIPI